MEKDKIRVILLEDNEVIRNVLCELFNRRGYEVFAFETPAICPLHLLPECRCNENESCADIILSDLEMPTISGLQFIKNQKDKSCKILHFAMMSGKWEKEELLKAKDLGCKIFHKPFQINDFNEWLDEVEKNISLERKLTDWFKELSGDI